MHQMNDNKVWTEEYVRYVAALSRDALSLDSPIEDSELGDLIADTSPRLDQMISREEQRKTIRSLVKNVLSPREELVITLRYGLKDGKNRTLDEIGSLFGVCKERIRQIELHAFAKLREALAKNDISLEE